MVFGVWQFEILPSLFFGMFCELGLSKLQLELVQQIKGFFFSLLSMYMSCHTTTGLECVAIISLLIF